VGVDRDKRENMAEGAVSMIKHFQGVDQAPEKLRRRQLAQHRCNTQQRFVVSCGKTHLSKCLCKQLSFESFDLYALARSQAFHHMRLKVLQRWSLFAFLFPPVVPQPESDRVLRALTLDELFGLLWREGAALYRKAALRRDR
jgi:hypothetical protein